MSNLKNLRFVCTKCGNCCTDKNTLVNLTYLDILRIKNGLNLDINEILEIIGFYIFDKKFSTENEKRLVINPIETEKGLAFIALLKNSDGDCLFYNSKEKKCSIYELRPMFCQTFPFSFQMIDINGKEPKVDIFYTEKGKQYCPGIGNEAPLVDQCHWVELGKKTLEDLKINHNVIKQWNESVKKGKIKPNAKKFLHTVFKLEDYIKSSD